MCVGERAPDRTGLPSGTAKADGEVQGQAVWLSHARIDCTSQAGFSGGLPSRGVPGRLPPSLPPILKSYCTQLLTQTHSSQLRDLPGLAMRTLRFNADGAGTLICQIQ